MAWTRLGRNCPFSTLLMVLAGTFDSSARRLIVSLRPRRSVRKRSLTRSVSYRERAASVTLPAEDFAGILTPLRCPQGRGLPATPFRCRASVRISGSKTGAGRLRDGRSFRRPAAWRLRRSRAPPLSSNRCSPAPSDASMPHSKCGRRQPTAFPTSACSFGHSRRKARLPHRSALRRGGRPVEHIALPHNAVSLARDFIADETGVEISGNLFRQAVERIADAAAAVPADIERIVAHQREHAPRDRLRIAGNGLEARRKTVHVVHFVRGVDPDVVVDAARIAAAKPLALREARALAGNDIVDAAIRRVM